MSHQPVSTPNSFGASASSLPYCASRFRAVRRRTREVMVGAVGVGGTNPIRIQSMTTSDTQDVAATVKQAIALADVGCEIVRITAPSVAAARCLREIRAQFSAAGFGRVPLVADIHFLPQTAMEAVEHVEKIRVNPGNYADRKKFAVREYSDAEYERELQRLHDAFSPLVKRCRELGRAMRIGTNHGSLSDRIMNRYGDTPLGMVESALEFIRIAEAHDYRAIILSMKASNPKVMIQAYRLLVARMEAENMHYPLHLGVTEAGDGEDGRIKSAIGIGSLLLDGLGDTIRVSLTEDSVYEIPVAQALAAKAAAVAANATDFGFSSLDFRLGQAAQDSARATPDTAGPQEIPNQKSQIKNPAAERDAIDPYRYLRREIAPLALGSAAVNIEQPPRVIVSAGDAPADPAALLGALRAAKARLVDTPIEGLLVRAKHADDARRAIAMAPLFAGEIETLVVEVPDAFDANAFRASASDDLRGVALVAPASAAPLVPQIATRGGISVLSLASGDVATVAPILAEFPATIVTLAVPAPGFTAPAHAIGAWRKLADALRAHGLRSPLWIRNTAATAIRHETSFLSRLLEASVLTGALLADGLGDFVSIETETDLTRATKLAYNVLQGAGARISKTEFVACPSCGRTLFDLQTTTQRIRAQTGHLKGVKLAIMGCIVNGPGEMADADFGYVGGAPGKINLYVGKNCVEYGIPAEHADARLIELIKTHGKWFDPPAAVETAAAPTS